MVLAEYFRDELRYIQRFGGKLADTGVTTPAALELRVDTGKWFKRAQVRITGTPQFLHKGRADLTDIMGRSGIVCVIGKQNQS